MIRVGLLIGVIALGVFLLIRLEDKTLRTTVNRHIKLGAWTEGLFDAKTKELHPEALLEFERIVKKKVAIAHYYIGWEYLADKELQTQFGLLRSFGWEPMLNVNPYYFSGGCPATKLPLYKAIAEGNCDDFLHKAGKNLSQINKPFYLLFAWEMNNPKNEWSVSYTGSSTDDFVRAWRHIYTIFKQENATNVIWVFCPNIPDNLDTPYSKLYPGDDFVDWTGLDGYNWGTTQSWSEWVSFSGVFTGPYNKLIAIAPDKPMMLAEVNTTDKGGDKGAWYKDMFIKQIPHNFPKVQAVVIYNEDRNKQENVDWRVGATHESLRDFSSAIHSEFY
mgnify:CR=1 FL=1